MFSSVWFGFGGVLVAWMVFPPAEQSNMLSALTGSLGAGSAGHHLLVHQAERSIAGTSKPQVSKIWQIGVNPPLTIRAIVIL
jgi:hypothetical protein